MSRAVCGDGARGGGGGETNLGHKLSWWPVGPWASLELHASRAASAAEDSGGALLRVQRKLSCGGSYAAPPPHTAASHRAPSRHTAARRCCLAILLRAWQHPRSVYSATSCTDSLLHDHGVSSAYARWEWRAWCGTLVSSWAITGVLAKVWLSPCVCPVHLEQGLAW